MEMRAARKTALLMLVLFVAVLTARLQAQENEQALEKETEKKIPQLQEGLWLGSYTTSQDTEVHAEYQVLPLIDTETLQRSYQISVVFKVGGIEVEEGKFENLNLLDKRLQFEFKNSTCTLNLLEAGNFAGNCQQAVEGEQEPRVSFMEMAPPVMTPSQWPQDHQMMVAED